MSVSAHSRFSNENNPISKPKPKRTLSWFTRRIFALAIVFGPCYCVWMAFGPLLPIRISKETTYFTEPLTPDGHVDFHAIAHGRPYDPNHQDPWAQLCLFAPKSVSYTELRSNSDTQTQEEREQNDQQIANCWKLPFSNEDSPKYAEIVAQNERWYQEVMATDPGPQHAAWGNQFPRAHDLLVRRFKLRAMHALGRGDEAQALESIRFMSRVIDRDIEHPSAVRLGFGPIASGVMEDTVRVALFSPAKPSEKLIDCALEVSRNRLPLAETLTRIEKLERAYCLYQIQKEHNAPPWTNTSRMDQAKQNWRRHRIDWNKLMRFQNEIIDEYMERIRSGGSYSQRTQLATAYHVQLSQEFPEARSSSFIQLLTWNAVISQDWNAQQLSAIASNRRTQFAPIPLVIGSHEQANRLTRLAVLLAVYRARTGTFPQSLDELRKEVQLPRISNEIYTDPLENKPWRFTSDGTSFQITPSPMQRSETKRTVLMEWPLPEN